MNPKVKPSRTITCQGVVASPMLDWAIGLLRERSQTFFGETRLVNKPGPFRLGTNMALCKNSLKIPFYS